MEVVTGFLQAGIEFINYDSGKKPVIADNVIINGLIDCCEQVTIEKDVFSGHSVKLLTGSHDPDKIGLERMRSSKSGPITIEEGVWLATDVVVLANVTIGKHSVICCGAVVTKDVPPYEMWGGVPARFIRKIKHED